MKITKQYIAGFVDGEGYIGISKKKDSRIKRGYTLRYRMKLTNQDMNVLKAIQEVYGGNIFDNRNKIKCYYLMIDTKAELTKILKDLIPYLITKKEKAKEIYNILKDRKGKKQGNKLSEDLINEYR